MKQETIRSIAGVISHYSHKYQEPVESLIASAFDGDIDAVEEIYCHAREADRAELMVMMFVYRAPKEVLRTMLMRVWDHEHQYLIRSIGIKMVKVIFSKADFSVPADTPPTLTVYRGGYGISQRKLAAGLSWTTDRDVACFFAMRFGRPDPMVLRATIRREEIRLLEQDQREDEVVIFGARRSVIDGDPAEWAERYKWYLGEKDRRWKMNMKVA
jgi:hypothetical protein